MARANAMNREREASNRLFSIDLAMRQGNKKSANKLYRDIFGGKASDYKPLNQETREAMDEDLSEEFKDHFKIVKAYKDGEQT